MPKKKKKKLKRRTRGQTFSYNKNGDPRIQILSADKFPGVVEGNGKHSRKYVMLFKKKGIVCSVCGIKGKYWVLEKIHDQDVFRWQLYAVDPIKGEVLMTKDHIVPKSKGGTDNLNNLVPMCSICNQKKGNKDEGF